MFGPFTRACLHLCAVLVTFATSPRPAPAFPDPKPADERPKVVPREKEAGALPGLPKVAADAPPLRKLQRDLVREGVAYIKRCDELIRSGTWLVSDFRKYADVLTDTCRTVAELEEKPADRVPWYEARVGRMKAVEDIIDRGVQIGSVSPQDLNLIRFQRIQAEIDLLKLKTEVEKAGGK